MASIRTQLRFTFAGTISLLLVACSVTIWLWAYHMAGHQVETLLARDAERLMAAVAWDPDLKAFKLHQASPGAHELTSDYWQIIGPDGAVIWCSSSWAGRPSAWNTSAAGARVFTIPLDAGRRPLLATRASFSPVPLAAQPHLRDVPEAALRAAHAAFGAGEIIAAEVEFEDDRLVYELIGRVGDDLLELVMDGSGQILEQTRHRVPTTLPAPVMDTVRRSWPDARVSAFDWRAGQGQLEFAITATRAGQTLRSCVDSTGRLVKVYFPAPGVPEPLLRVVVADSHAWRSALLGRLALLLASVCGAGLLVTFLISSWLVRRTLKPIGAIARKASHIDDRRLSERLAGGRANDEISMLVDAINGMLERIESAFDRQRRFARDASHELRGPLTGLIAQLELARARISDSEPAADNMDSALERGQRLRDLIEKLLLLARQDSDQPVSMREDVDISECLRHVAADFPPLLRERIHLQTTSSDLALVHGNEELLHAMFRNIVDNALKYGPPDAPVDVSVHEQDKELIVDVVDLGPGIPVSARDRVFEPFMRLGEAGPQAEGSGLGLSIVRWIASLHHARISLSTPPKGAGTAFRTILPKVATE